MDSGAATLQEMTPSERFAAALALVPEIAQVEAIVRNAFRSDVAPMRDIPEYLLSLGGKRIRPALTLLCARASAASNRLSEGPNRSSLPDDILNVAAGIELIHMATLMHDDIIDQSPIRRHKQSPHAKFGTPLTLLSGDFLLTRAFGLCARLDDTIITATEQACIELVEGEALETPLHIERHTLESSLTIAQRKTASLFRLAAFCAGHICQASPAAVEALARFGENIGIAFQIIDDVLDVTADETTLGKQPGLDIIERKPSVVNVLWLRSGDVAAQRLLSPPIAGAEGKFAQKSIADLREGPVVEQAKQLARAYGQRATEALNDALQNVTIPPGPASQALYSVIDFALERLK